MSSLCGTGEKRTSPLALILILTLAFSFMVGSLSENNALGVDDEGQPNDCVFNPELGGEDCTVYGSRGGGGAVGGASGGPLFPPLPNYLPDYRLFEEHKMKLWEIRLAKDPSITCEQEGTKYNCYHLDENGRASVNFCKNLISTVCQAVMSSLCVVASGTASAATATPVGIFAAAACIQSGYNACTQVGELACKHLEKKQRRLIISFPDEPSR